MAVWGSCCSLLLNIREEIYQRAANLMHGSSARYKNEDFQGLITWESLKQLYKKTIYDELMTHTWNITMQDVNHLVEGNQSNYNEEHKLYGSP